MSEVFLKILNMSIAASWLILTVILLRFLLKKAPKWIAVLLWGIVALRLAVPFSFESALSLIPSAETFSHHNIQYETPAINSGIPAVNNAVNPFLGETFAPNPASSVNPLYVWTYVMSIIWLMGIAAMLLYAVISYVRVYRSVAERAPLQGNIFLCDSVKSPFILGLVRPKIYLPSGMDTMAMEPMIAHEKAHLARHDHWWKPMGFLILTVHWFNPLCWIAYVLLCRDIELACDEKVIQQMDLDGKKQYSTALLECSAVRRMVTICPLAFGEVGVKERIKNVLHYKKPMFWVIILAVLACAVVTVCFATNPVSTENSIRLQTTHSTPPAAFFTLDLAKEMQGTVIAERWENGRCVSTDPIFMNNLTQQIQLYLDPQENGVNVQLGVDNGDTLLEIFSYPEGEKPIGWSFVSLDEGEKTILQSGKDRIIAAMAFDFGTGVKSYSCDTLSADQQRVENAAYLIVIRTILEDRNDSMGTRQNTPREGHPISQLDMPMDTDPKSDDGGGSATEEPDFSTFSDEQTAIHQAILEHNRSAESTSLVSCSSFVELACLSVDRNAPLRKIHYGWALYEEYKVTDDGLKTVTSSYIPVAITLQKESGTLIEYWEPRDGSYYAQDIQEKFPAHIAEDGIDSQKFILQQKQECYAQAVVSTRMDTNKVIEKLIETICNGPSLSSKSWDYIDEHAAEYQELIYYGGHTLKYCFARFEKGNETGLAGHIMMQVCADIAGGWDEALLELVCRMPEDGSLTGQFWYDAFKSNALGLMEQYTEMELAERYPASYLLLNMLGVL